VNEASSSCPSKPKARAGLTSNTTTLPSRPLPGPSPRTKPGLAVSYFDGYRRLLEIRQATEKALGSKFNVQKFHDFVLSQGLLPPDLLRKAVMEDFVAKQK
jgi:hypothetical protein